MQTLNMIHLKFYKMFLNTKHNYINLHEDSSLLGYKVTWYIDTLSSAGLPGRVWGQTLPKGWYLYTKLHGVIPRTLKSSSAPL